MSVQSQLQTAEEAVRQALINALAEGEDQYLTDLFNLLNTVRDMNKKVSNTIRYTDNTTQWAKDWSEYNFNLNSDYLSSIDNIAIGTTDSPDVIKFPTRHDDIDLGLD